MRCQMSPDRYEDQGKPLDRRQTEGSMQLPCHLASQQQLLYTWLLKLDVFHRAMALFLSASIFFSCTTQYSTQSFFGKKCTKTQNKNRTNKTKQKQTNI